MEINTEMKIIELEKARLKSEERQKREELKHQFNMMEIIFGRMGGTGNKQQPSGGQNSQWQEQSRNRPSTRRNRDVLNYNVPQDSTEQSYYNF